MYVFSIISAALVYALLVTATRHARQYVNSTYSVKTPPLTTQWTYEAGINPFPQYPRPKLQRTEWSLLNGLWRYRNATDVTEVQRPPVNQTWTSDVEVLVPSCLESGLSGAQVTWAINSWFRTTFEVPANWTHDRTLLNFGAVDYEATVFVNGRQATDTHSGGYSAFSIDITSLLMSGSNELLVFVHDPTDSGEYVIPIGKQTLNPSHIFYTPCSGIWQSVWIESAPSSYITQLNINGDKDGMLNVTVASNTGDNAPVSIVVYEKGTTNTVASYSGQSNTALQFNVSDPKLWSPDSPSLYDVAITFGQDAVTSYTGFRSITRGEVQGIQRFLLNGEVVFPFGTLDQGYWPDGIYVPPNYEAMVYDLQTLKQLGFNMLRKHMKVETDIFYQACDEIGLLVIQDMPALRPLQSRTLANCTMQTILPDDTQQAEFQRQLEVLVTQHRSYTCIISWVVYNEGWGQITTTYPEFDLVDRVRSLDPTRLVDATSGWYDHGAGDYSDNHHYANPQCGTPFYSSASSAFDPRRLGFQGEFGGIGQNATEHLWNVAAAIATIDQTYEIDETVEIWNYRAHFLLAELLSQIELFACSGAVWTQTTDVEGEVNGLLTYDRRLLRADSAQWRADILALYAAVAARASSPQPTFSSTISYASMARPLPTEYWATRTWEPAPPPANTRW